MEEKKKLKGTTADGFNFEIDPVVTNDRRPEGAPL